MYDAVTDRQISLPIDVSPYSSHLFAPMSTSDAVRKKVREFSANHRTGDSEADSFAAWWLHRRFKLSILEAARRAPGGNHDYGIDAFHLDCSGPTPTLYLVQAKFTENASHIRKGFSGFIKLLEPLKAFIDGREFSISVLNPVVQNLSSELAVLRVGDPAAFARLQLAFLVIHLSDTEPESILTHCRPAIQQLTDELQNLLPDIPAEAHQELPSALVEGISLNTIAPEIELRFHGESIPSDDSIKHLAGFGYLSDLVGLYESYREALFSKNVRYFQMDKVQKGPAGHMRETLRSICIPRNGKFAARPDSFSLFHNGVTLTASKANRDSQKSTIRLANPNVLNGCQTIKNAFLMLRAEGASSKLIDMQQWNEVVVPMRVVVTRDESLVRRITVGLNRQNAIRPAAFRANEPEQVRLEQRFGEIGIFYERQEKAFKNFRGADPARLSQQFPNSSSVPLGMEELAQSIAVAADKPAISGISNIAELFEETLYRQIFDEARLEDLQRLVFLRNVLACSKFCAIDLRGKAKALSSLQPGKFRYVLARVIARYAIQQNFPEIEEFGAAIEPKFGPKHPLRVRMGAWCGHSHTGLQQNIPALWGAGGPESQWLSPTDANATQSLLRKAKVDTFDVFG